MLSRVLLAVRAPLLLAALLVAGRAYASPAEADRAYEAGRAAAKAGRLEEALGHLERSAELAPERADTWFHIGAIHSRLKQWDEAIAGYERGLALDAGSARAWHNLGNVHFRVGAFEAAERDYGRAVALEPAYQLALFHHGWTLRQLGRQEEAERAFRACLEVPAQNERDRKTATDCLFGLGSMRHRLGDYATSAELMERVLVVFPHHPEARYYLAMAYRQLGRIEDAERELERHRELLQVMRPHDPIEAPDEP
jgi:tetratricopeptide (TPR) repeat protein